MSGALLFGVCLSAQTNTHNMNATPKFTFKKGMDVKVSNGTVGISIMKVGTVTATDWPFVGVEIDGTEQWFIRNDVFPLHFYNC